MTALAKIFSTIIGVILSTIFALVIIGANEIRDSQIPLLYLLILIQFPLVTVIWAQQVSMVRRGLAYMIGLSASLLALYFIAPYFRYLATTSMLGAFKKDPYAFWGAGLLGILMLLGCMIGTGYIVPAIVLKLGRRHT